MLTNMKIITTPIVLLTLLSSSLVADKAIAKKNVNVREGGSLSDRILEVVPKGDRLEIIEKIDFIEDGIWYKTSRGYVFAELLELLPTEKKIELPKKEKVKTQIQEIKKAVVKPKEIKAKKESPIQIIVESKKVEIKPMSVEVIKEENTLVNMIQDSKESSSSKNIYLGVSSGFNTLKSDNSNTLTLNTIDSSGYNFILELGYMINDNLNISINYQRVLNDSVSMNNYYMATEYSLNQYNNLTPYIGASLGTSELSWEEQPIDTMKNDLKSSSYILGATLGTLYKINNEFSLNLNYQLHSLTKHKTKIETISQKGEIEHKLSHSVNIGIRYFF